ncbi:MAG: adenosylhomocysteinase [Acidimicrobiia bacterium]|nr:adenosylhomocysteinase [Acidimicrobiia bacterium]
MSDIVGRLDFVSDHMPIVGAKGERFAVERPFDGLTIAVRVHVEPKTAVLIRALRDGGGRVIALGNKGTTDDELAELLRSEDVEVLGERADDNSAIARHLRTLEGASPEIVLDNGAELIELLVASGDHPIGATEETTSGALTLRSRLADRVTFPVIVINDSPLKAIVENKHGVGQSVIETIRLATNSLIQRRRLVVLGYGWCGRGIALYGKAAGADVVVVEPDAVKALEAAIDGFAVSDLSNELDRGDIFVTATGAQSVIGAEQVAAMKDNVILANAGHFDDEIDVVGLHKLATSVSPRGDDIRRYSLPNGKSVDLISEGKMVNLAVTGSRGNSIEIMDLGFALQALSLERIALDPDSLPVGDQPVPSDIDETVARAMVAEMMK